MPMPKTTIDENYDTIFAQYYVWCSRKTFYIFTITVASVV